MSTLATPDADVGVATRRTALSVLARVQEEDAFANIVLPATLDRSDLDERDRALVTDLVYGSLRHRRSCEYLASRFLSEDPPPAAARALLLGTYQLVHRPDIPTYAAVSATVGAAPKRYRGLVNAVLRRVGNASVEYPDEATELSYPDWILHRLTADLGHEQAVAALRSMNEPPKVHTRSDGYVQDPASQEVAAYVLRLLHEGGGDSGQLVYDLCAAPGGKATAIATSPGVTVVACDQRPSRVSLIVSNRDRLGATGVLPSVMDATAPALRPSSADAVMIDAPCSGLGVLRRRPDARWRIDEDAPQRLAVLQRRMVDAAMPLLAPGGLLIYSVCTLTTAETVGVAEHVSQRWPDLEPQRRPGGAWEPCGDGAMLLPQSGGTDGMAVFAWRAGQVRSATTGATSS